METNLDVTQSLLLLAHQHPELIKQIISLLIEQEKTKQMQLQEKTKQLELKLQRDSTANNISIREESPDWEGDYC